MSARAAVSLRYRTVHVEGRTPGPRGKAPMVTVEDGAESETDYEGSHHEAVYLSAVIALAEALRNGERGLRVTSPSDHLIGQMNGDWEVGEELHPYHELLKLLEGLFSEGVKWEKAPRTQS